MNIVERRYRLLNVAEDLQHIAEKVSRIQDTVIGGDRDRHESFQFYLRRAGELLQTMACPSTRGEMKSILQASLDGIQEKALADALVSAQQTERPTLSQNVSPFSNRQQSNLTNGE